MRQPIASPDNIDLSTLLASIRRKAVGVLILSMCAGVLTYVALSMVAPRYVSQSELTISSKGTTNPFSGPRENGGGAQVRASLVDKEAVNTHVRALQSPDLAGDIALKLKLSGVREFNSALGPEDSMGRLLKSIGFFAHNPGESERDRVQRAFFERLVVFSPAQSRIITIQFRSSNPQLAAEIANTMARDYRARLALATVVETDAVQKSLAPKIVLLTKEVTKAEASVAKYRASTGLLRGGSQRTPLNQQQLGDLTGELTRASAARSAIQASASTARELILQGRPEVIPQVQRSPLIQNLIQQRVQAERDLGRLSATMKHAHPRIRQLNAGLSSIKRQVSVEVAHVVASLDKEAHAAIVREASIKKSIQLLKMQVADTSDEQIEVSRLEAVAKSKSAELGRLQAQFEANRARADSGAVPVEAEIVSVARPASVASYPSKGSTTGLVSVAVFLVGMAWVITNALLKGAAPLANVVTSEVVASNQLRDEIASVAAMPAPVLDGGAGVTARSNGNDAVLQLGSPAELGHHLLNLGSGAATCRTLIVSNDTALQAATLGLELGKSLTFAKANTILIEWSPRARTAAFDGGETGPVPGMMDLLCGTARFSEVVRAARGGNTHTINGGTPLGVGEDVDVSQLNVVLDALDEAYDQVVVVSAVEPAKALFKGIEGRVDVGVIVEAGPDHPLVGAAHDAPGKFLGFDVQGVSLVSLPAMSEPRRGPRGVPLGVASAVGGLRTDGGALRDH